MKNTNYKVSTEIINGEEMFFVLVSGNGNAYKQVEALVRAGLVHCGWANDYNFMVFRRTK